MKTWTKSALEKLSDDQLLSLYDNSSKMTTEAARSVKTAIEEMIVARDELSVGESGLKLASPVGLLLQRIINSPEAIDAAVQATQSGQPALAGVEPIIISRLGLSYTRRYEATVQAGYVIGKMMDRLGHSRTGRKGPMPEGSTASTSEIYGLKK